MSTGNKLAMSAGWTAHRGYRGLGRWWAIAGLVWSVGCGTDGATSGAEADSGSAGSADSSGSTGGKDATSSGDAIAKTDAAQDAIVEPTPDEKFWIVYDRIPRVTGTDKSDYVLSGPENPAASGAPGLFKSGVSPLDPTKPAIELTKIAFANAGGYNCQYGCFISKDLKWMAVAAGNADATGHYTYALGAVAPDLSVKIGKFGLLKDVKHLVFAGNYIFYSQKAKCLGTGSCQYDIHRQGPLGAADFADVVLTRMAPDDDEDVINSDTVYQGYFRVSEDASTVLFLTPTIRSTKIWVWRGGNLSKLDYICPNWDGVKCVGSGSQYHDNDPAALSVDGKRAVMFAIWDRWLRVRRYDVGSEAPGVFSNLVEVPANKPYLNTVCAVLGEDQHAEVQYEPWFSADGSQVYFVGYSKCGSSNDKVWTDVMSLPVEKIGQPLQPGDWVNWTKNPRDNTTKNREIHGLAMSPQRQVFVLAATPTVSEQGQPIPDTDKRQMKDSEIYTMPVGGTKMTLVTNETAWYASQPSTVPPMTAP